MLRLWRSFYLFGSSATGDATPSSDIDLALLLSAKLSAAAALAIKAGVSALFHRDVDLIDLRRADAVTKAQVIATGEVLLNAVPVTVALFETTAFAQYALLNEERSGIITDIVARGSIHG